MQTYIIVSGSILNVSTVHLNGIWHLIRGFNNFGDKRLFEVEQTAVIEKGP